MGNAATSLEKTTLGGYRLIAALGKGGMASVYLAMSAKAGHFRKLVVVKVLHPELAANAEFLAMFLGEARLAARLNHPNVIQTYEVGADQGMHFLVMEYLEGQPYNQIIKKVRGTDFPLEYHVKTIIDVLSGLHYAHELKDFDGTPFSVVHRDVSPQNVFVTYDGQVKILDFGVAKAASMSAETQAGVIKGKIAYLAPEQAIGATVDRRADLFSIGVMLWEAIADRRFAVGSIDVATIHNRVTGGEPRIRAVKPEVHPELADICDKALAVEPDARYRTAEEFKHALEEHLEHRNQRCKAEFLGSLVSDMFAEERSGMRTVVDAHARTIESLPPASLGRVGGSVGSLSGASSADPLLQSAPKVSEPSSPSASGSSQVVLVEHPRSRAGVILGASALVVAVAVGLFVVRGRGGVAAVPAAGPASAAASTPKSAGEKGDLVEVIVLASPPEARIFLDGTQTTGNPFRIQVAKDPAPHKVRVAFEGFATEERVVAFDANQTVRVTLQRLDGAVATVPAFRGTVAHGRPTAVSATAKSDVPTPSATTPKEGQNLRDQPAVAPRRVDDKDPYSQ